MTIVFHASGRPNPAIDWKRPLGGVGLAAALLLTGAPIADAVADTPNSGVGGPGGLASHRTLYEFSLAESGARGGLESISGTMSAEWSHDCVGWTIAQTVDMVLYDRMGGAIEIASTYATWEAFDGSSFSFRLAQDSDVTGSQTLRGTATRHDGKDGGEGRVAVEYRSPTEGSETLPAGIIFPVAHTVELIERAAAGEPFYAATVFDGTEMDWEQKGSAFDISATVSAAGLQAGPETGSETDERIDDSLREAAAWRIVLAHFSSDAELMSPEFQTTMRLFGNGVADRLALDYGDFVVDATLTELERLPEPSCEG